MLSKHGCAKQARVARLIRSFSFSINITEHASHVAMSVSKLLSRIVAPDVQIAHQEGSTEQQLQLQYASRLHDHTYGITSDPITHFAIVFSALIHDAGTKALAAEHILLRCVLALY